MPHVSRVGTVDLAFPSDGIPIWMSGGKRCFSFNLWLDRKHAPVNEPDLANHRLEVGSRKMDLHVGLEGDFHWMISQRRGNSEERGWVVSEPTSWGDSSRRLPDNAFVFIEEVRKTLKPEVMYYRLNTVDPEFRRLVTLTAWRCAEVTVEPCEWLYSFSRSFQLKHGVKVPEVYWWQFCQRADLQPSFDVPAFPE